VTARARLRVDPIACDARGLCAEILPELIALDDWGFPVIGGDDVPVDLLEEAREAVRLCPRLALWLEPAAGRSGRRVAGTPAGREGKDGHA